MELPWLHISTLKWFNAMHLSIVALFDRRRMVTNCIEIFIRISCD